MAPLLLPDILGSYPWVHGRFSCFLERYLLSSLCCEHWHLQSHLCICSGTMSAPPVPVETGNPTLIQRFKKQVQVCTDPQRPGISGHREISWDTSGGHFHVTSGPEFHPHTWPSRPGQPPRRESRTILRRSRRCLLCGQPLSAWTRPTGLH